MLLFVYLSVYLSDNDYIMTVFVNNKMADY